MQELKRLARANLAELLDLFDWGLEVITRHDCLWILLGLHSYESDRSARQLIYRLERRQWVRREGRGDQARFALTPEGARQRPVLDPAANWSAPWDGKWRLFTYDLPERRRTERILLWRALHARKLGLLQRSVWVWPHPVEALLQDTLRTNGIPECFCGFTCERLFLSTDAELVAVSWDFPKIGQAHQSYLESVPRFLDALRAARDLQGIARVAGVERQAHQQAFDLDPLLPEKLWPREYAGPEVQRSHARFRDELCCRVRELAGK